MITKNMKLLPDSLGGAPLSGPLQEFYFGRGELLIWDSNLTF